jgi:heat shock protein HslJ
MKNIFLLVSLISVIVSGCCSKKANDMKTQDSKTSIYDAYWELEYISGLRIAFEGLYPEKKPYIRFTAAESQFGGDSSCNVYSGKYTIKGNAIHFGDAIKTMRWCEGGGEEAFLNMLGKVNKFAIDSEGKLLLLKDDIPMMRFKKIAKPQQ